MFRLIANDTVTEINRENVMDTLGKETGPTC